MKRLFPLSPAANKHEHLKIKIRNVKEQHSLQNLTFGE